MSDRALRGAAVGVFLLACGASAASAATYQVGPGRTYAKLQDVAPLLQPGDLVEVDGDATYPGDVTFRQRGSATAPITIRGIRVNGKRPVIAGGVNTVHFRTDVIGQGADHYVMEGFEITGGSSRCVFHQSHDVTLRDLVVHHCPSQGILGADWGSGSLTVEFSEVYACGVGTGGHQIYASADQDNYPGSVFRLEHSWIHDGNGGNNVKSRAARNEIYYNRIEGAYYHELELIGSECCAEPVVREDGDVVGNLFIKKGPNATFFVTRFGGDGTGQSWGRYRFVNNTVISGSSAVFRLFHGLESLEAHNNVFYRVGGAVNLVRTAEAVWSSGQQIVGSNNWMTTGATNVTGSWTGTITGSDPGFVNAAAGDYSPAAGSPLLAAATDTPAGPAGFPFPDPLFPPAFQPPGAPGAFGTANPRPADGQLDIGAWERGSGGGSLISAGDVTVAEGNSGVSTLTFTITLSPAAGAPVTVGYATADGTATSGDYVAASGNVTFAPGETAKTVAVSVLGDTAVEADETLYLNLSDASGASIGDGQAKGTIVDDDVPPPAIVLSIGDVSVAEGLSGVTSAVFTVSLSSAAAQDVTVHYLTADGSAAAGSDYTAAAGSIVLPAGTTSATITVAVVGDSVREANETFFVDLGSAVGATVADARGQGTIVNDDKGKRAR